MPFAADALHRDAMQITIPTRNATELVAEVSELHNKNAELRAKAEQASLLQEENARLRSLLAKSQPTH